MVAALTRPIPKFHQNSGDHCSVREQRGCQNDSGNSSREKQGKAAGKRLLHHTDISISSPGSTGSCHRNKPREAGMCRWDLSPAILLLFPAGWDCKSPSLGLLHRNWHMVLAAPSLTRQRPGQALKH